MCRENRKRENRAENWWVNYRGTRRKRGSDMAGKLSLAGREKGDLIESGWNVSFMKLSVFEEAELDNRRLKTSDLTV